MTTAIPTFRILIAGWDRWPRNKSEIIAGALYLAAELPEAFDKPIFVIHAASPHGGVDQWAHEWANFVAGAMPMPWPVDPADGTRGLEIRNQKMVDAGADLCLAFYGHGGFHVLDLIRRAEAAGIPVHKRLWADYDPSTRPAR